jgi:hypothetical protein
MHKLSSFLTKWSTKHVQTIHFMFGGQFGVCQKDKEDGLRALSGDFFIKYASRKKHFQTNCPSRNLEIVSFWIRLLKTLSSLENSRSKFIKAKKT